MISLYSIVVGAVLLGSAGALAQADEEMDVHPYLTDKFSVDVGVFFPVRQFTVNVNGSVSGPSDPIDFEGDFGIKETDNVFSLNFGWRFGEKWQLEGQYFGASSSRSAVLEEDVEWKDIVFLASSGIKGGQDFSLIRTFFARRFESGKKHEFGLGVGVHWLEIGAFVQGNIATEGGAEASARESVSAFAPLPNIGAWYMYSMSPKWALKTHVDWFDASIDDYDGSLTNAAIGVNYQIFEHAGIGLNYNVFKLDLNLDKPSWRGSANVSYEGLYAYLSFYW